MLFRSGMSVVSPTRRTANASRSRRTLEVIVLVALVLSAVLTGCCIHGFEKAALPELRVGFVGTYHHRRLIREIAQRLSVL